MSGPQCCSNPPTLNPAAGSGHVEKLGGVDSYLTGSSHSNFAVLLVSDIYGYEAPNLRNLADKVAAAGYYVVVPDFFNGDPYNPENANRPVPVWLKDHGMDKGFEDAKSIIESLKSKGVSGIGAAGFCWGAKVVVELAKSRLIQAAVLLHPSFVSLDDIKGVDIPTAILGAEIDKMSPPELVKQFEQVLTAKPGVDSFVKIFPKVSHGWSVRYSNEDAEAVKTAEEAHQDLLNWFEREVQRESSSEKMSGAECCSNPPTLDPSSGDGHVNNFGGLNSYLTGSSTSNFAILFVSDIFAGYEAPLLRKLADKVAAAGYLVVVPDFFNGDPFTGDPFDPENVDRPLPVWIKDHEPEKGFEAAKPIIEALKSEGVTAIGAAGFCWGAKTVTELGKSRLIQVSAILHPAFVTVDDIDGVKVPIAILGAEEDTVTPSKLIKQFEQVPNAKSDVGYHMTLSFLFVVYHHFIYFTTDVPILVFVQADSYVKVFPEVPHGWTVRYDSEDAEAVKAAEEAHQILLDWFHKHLNSQVK